MVWVYAHTFNDSVIRKYMINTKNCIKYFVIIYNEKESKKEYLFIYISESLCCTPETNTIL